LGRRRPTGRKETERRLSASVRRMRDRMAPASVGIRGARETGRIARFIVRTVEDASAGGTVVALSGGVDSAVVGALCVRALGEDRVFVLLLPSDHTPEKDSSDARRMADSWGVRWSNIPISGIVDALALSSRLEGTKIAKGNLEARVRMTLLYYHANSLGYLVAGTGDRSESVLGYFTKFGDGGADLLPIAHLFKTQVRQLATYLGLPSDVAEKPASPQLWPGHSALDEIPAGYEKLDIALHCIYDLKMSPAGAARRAGVPKHVIDRIMEMHRRSEHKRRMPPSLAAA